MAKREEQPNRWVLVVMMALSVVMALSGRGMASRLRGVMPYVLGPLADVGMYVTTAFRANFRGDDEQAMTLSKADQQLLAALARGDVDRISPADLARLQAIIDTQAARLARHWRAKAESAKSTIAMLSNFRGLFGPNEDLSCQLIPARVAARDSLAYGQMRLLSAGRRRGAVEGDQVTTRLLLTNRAKALEPHNKLAVATGTALVGRLGETGPYTARLILVTDRAFSMAAHVDRKIDYANPRLIRVERSGAVTEEPLSNENNAYVPCLAEGNGSDAVIVRGVSKGHAIRPGDELVARVAGTYETTPVPIGKVVEVIDDPKLGAGFDQLRVAPAVDLAALREVLIIVPTLGISEDGR